MSAPAPEPAPTAEHIDAVMGVFASDREECGRAKWTNEYVGRRVARAILTSVDAAGKAIPVVTGQDSEVESIKSIMAGKQYSTINKDTRKLVAATIDMVKALQAGQKPTVTDDKSYNNGVKVVPANLLTPVIATKENAAEVYKDDPTLGPLTK